MKTIQFIAAVFLSGFSLAAPADFLSVSAGGGVWNAGPEGELKKTGDPLAIDPERDLHLDSESQGYLFVTLEHFIPLVPNFRVMYTSMDNSGRGTSSFIFDGQSFSGTIDTSVSIEETDLTLYYEVLDNIVSLDLGLNVRRMDIDYTVQDTLGNRTSDSISATFPMVYGLVGASPWPDLIVSAEASYISLSGNTASDLIARVAYTTNLFIGLEAGYRMQRIELDDEEDTDADLEFNGVFAGVYVKF